MNVVKNLILCLFLGLDPREAEHYTWTDFAAMFCGRKNFVIVNQALHRLIIRYLR